MGSWLYGKKPGANDSTQSLDSLAELRDRECLLNYMVFVLRIAMC